MNSVRIPTHDGEINGTLLLPEGTPVGFLTIHSATATPARFYLNFANYAVTRGLAVLTYDMRGVGDSGPARKYSRVRMRDWMQQDVNAVAAWAKSEFPELPKVALGHSVGGHALLLGNGDDDLRGVIIIAAARAAMRDIHPFTERLKVGFILRLLAPLITPIIGYAPGKRLGLGEDIPHAAVLEWGRWVSMSEYFFDDPTLGATARMARLRTPVLAVGASDDRWASPDQIDELVDRLRLAEVERRTFTPEELGVPQIGHHDLLRRSVSEGAWPEIVDWLLQRLPQS